jgi:hypothetical protein
MGVLVGEGVSVSTGVEVGLGVNVSVGFGEGVGIGVKVSVGGIGDGGTGVTVQVGSAEIGAGDAVGIEMVGASVGSVKIDVGFPLASMMLNNPPMAINIRAGAIHLSRVILDSLLVCAVRLPRIPFLHSNPVANIAQMRWSDKCAASGSRYLSWN